ncbi:UNVERIFIED_CONTAM: hypothetical protein K2H54_002636 [Gekko kuhli]
MDQSGCLRSHRSPKTCRSRASHKRTDRASQYPRSADEDDDWETDPDYVNDDSRQRGGRRVSTASIISDLSRSIRDCSLRRPVSHNQKEPADRLHSEKESAWMPTKDPEGHRAPLCPQVRSSPSLGIERSSVFNRNAAETLDTFFSEKLKAWASDDAPLSDSYENMEAPPKPASPGKGRRRTEKTHAGPERTGRRQHPCHPIPARGMVVERACSSWDNYQQDTYYDQGLRHEAPLSRGPEERQGGRRPSTAASSSARILPQCRISHVQSCGACQAFNRELPAGTETFYEECWSRSCPEDGDGGTRKKRTGTSSQRRLSKVQQWLAQTPVEEPPGPPKAEKQAGVVLESPRAPRRCTACGSLGPKEGDPWGRAGDGGDRWSPEDQADPRHGRKPHKARRPGHQPVARIVTCDDTSASPAECSCLFCERQKARAGAIPANREGKKGMDPSAQEVAVQLQAENRLPRIVEAFERRSLREAKMAERDRAYQSSRHRDPEKRARVAKSRGDGKPGHPPQGRPKARKSRSKEEPEEEPGSGPEGCPKHSHGKGQPVGKRPSFLDRLRGLY